MPEFVKRFQVSNFRCLREVAVDLEPLTVLVGPNAAGKSALMEALNPEGSIDHRTFWLGGSTRIERTWAWNTGASFRSHSEDLQGRTPRIESGSTGTPPRVQLLRLDLTELRRPQTVAHAVQLTSSGSNLANGFASIPRQEKEALAALLAELVPVIRDVDVRPDRDAPSGSHIVLFQDRWKKPVWFRPYEVSDGTLLLFAFLLLQFQPSPPDIVTIEEPERGLHPYLLENLVGFLRGLATGTLGPRPIQVVVATHSPTLLNFVRPEEVRILSRSKEDGSTIVRRPPSDTQEWKDAFRDDPEAMGEIWLSGALGGVPGSG